MKARFVASALLPALTAVGVSGAAGTVVTPPARQPSAQNAVRHRALTAYQALPAAFVPNAGQLDRRVRFSAQAERASVFLTRREAVVAFAKGRRGLALRLRFLGANPAPTITGARRSAGRVNYLIGNNPARWRTNVPTYREVVYRELWPGIELRVRGAGVQLKYEFRLAPGADPSTIRLAYRGQERLSLGRDGALRIETALGLLRDPRPRSYQPIAGRRVAVASRFAPGRGGVFGFALGAYDRRFPLVIDPGLVYSTFLGGSDADSGHGIAVDRSGSVYVTGWTGSRDFPTTASAVDRSGNGYDASVTKLNAAGSALVYSTYLGGSDIDTASAIAVDGAGNVYLTGFTDSRDFPTTAGAFDRDYNGNGDAFVTKLGAAGSALAYSTYLGTSTDGQGVGIAVDGAGSAYVTGRTYSTDFPTTAGAFDTSANGLDDAFVTKLNAAGSALAYSTYLGGRGWDYGDHIVVDGTGSAYVMGQTDSRNFPTSAGAFDRSNGVHDAFVTKLNPAGSDLAYSTFLGGRYDDSGHGIAVDAAGSAYLTGSTQSPDFPTTLGAFDTSFNPNLHSDAFVTKLNAAGSALVYSTHLGGSGHDSGLGIAVDGAGGAYVTGQTDSRDFPTTAGAFDRDYNRGYDYGDAFVTKLNTAGSALTYSTYLGGSDEGGSGLGDDSGLGVAVDAAGGAYVAGWTNSRDFPTTARAFDRSSNGDGDAFVTKLDLIAGPVRCWVPRVIGMKLAKAKRTIRAMDCSVGRVRRVRSPLVGRVLRQSPRAGAVRRRGFKVNLVVGRR